MPYAYAIWTLPIVQKIFKSKSFNKTTVKKSCILLIDTSPIDRLLKELHVSYLKNNKYDEGDLLFYRINYKLIDSFGITQDEAKEYHFNYHKHNPRRVSEGYCHICKNITSIIPIIYGVSKQDIATIKAAEDDKRLIIGTLDQLKKGNRMALFGCKICLSPLPNYGTT
jgi:hypothetical protein